MKTRRSIPSTWFAAVKQRKAVAVVVGWAVLVGLLALFAPSVTVREQTTVAQALPQLESAVGDAAGMLTGKPHGYWLGSLSFEGDCDITAVRSGEEYSRSLTVYAGKAHVEEVFDDLYKGLRNRYSLAPAYTQTPSYAGTSSEYVEFDLSIKGVTVEWRASTGCRPPADSVGQLAENFSPPSESVTVLSTLGVNSSNWSSTSVDCGDLSGPGGSSTTDTAVAKLPKDAGDLATVAKSIPEDAKIDIETKKVLSYRLGDMRYTASVDGSKVTVHATSQCSG